MRVRYDLLLDPKRVEEAFRQLSEGRSYRRVARELGIPLATLHRLYNTWLLRKIEENRRVLKELEARVSELQAKTEELSKKYEDIERFRKEVFMEGYKAGYNARKEELTYRCNICGGKIYPDEEEMEFLTKKGWGHTCCHDVARGRRSSCEHLPHGLKRR